MGLAVIEPGQLCARDEIQRHLRMGGVKPAQGRQDQRRDAGQAVTISRPESRPARPRLRPSRSANISSARVATCSTSCPASVRVAPRA